MTPPWYVLTGGPSAGKTTLLRELAARGWKTVDEAARAVIEEEVAKGRTYAEVRADEAAFQRGLVARKRNIERKLSRTESYFFDRGIPDSDAYYRLIHLPEDDDLRAGMRESSYRQVFLLDLIPFKQDDVRKESFEEAERLNVLLRESYEKLGISVVQVPVMSLSERVAFVLDRLIR